MAKDRNSMAKRQRESDKLRRAQEKKERRDHRKLTSGSDDGAADFALHMQLSSDEIDVLDTFAKFLMPPDQMLCLSNADIPATRRALEQLIGRGLLMPDDFKGGYSLTVEGFSVMQQMRADRS